MDRHAERLARAYRKTSEEDHARDKRSERVFLIGFAVLAVAGVGVVVASFYDRHTRAPKTCADYADTRWSDVPLRCLTCPREVTP
jgi:hypothetical protein